MIEIPRRIYKPREPEQELLSCKMETMMDVRHFRGCQGVKADGTKKLKEKCTRRKINRQCLQKN